MKILGIIPARGGSKRIPGKNKKLLAGKQLVCYSIEAAVESRLLSEVVVSTDDDEILAIAGKYSPKGVIAIRRPEEISGDDAPAITYVQHALKTLENPPLDVYEIVVILQPTSPLTLAEDIDGTIQLLLNSGADSAVSVVKVPHDVNPIKMKTMQGNRLQPFLEEENGRMTAKQLPELFVRNCSVYASTRKTIDSQLIIGQDCRGYIMPTERSVDINEPLDFEFAAFLLNRNYHFNT